MCHTTSGIPKGELGEFSKIMEEVLELHEAMHLDAANNNGKVLMIAELVDIIGAVSLFTQRYIPCLSIDDLVEMSKVTQRLFEARQKEAQANAEPTATPED